MICRQGAAANPDSEEQQQKLREAAEGLRIATNAAAQNAIKKRLVNKLEVEEPTENAFTHRTVNPTGPPRCGKYCSTELFNHNRWIILC